MFALSILTPILESHGFWIEEIHIEIIMAKEPKTEINKENGELKNNEA